MWDWPGLLVPNEPYGFCGRKAPSKKKKKTDLENDNPGKSNVVKGDSPLERIESSGLAAGVILIPVDAGVIGWGVVAMHGGTAIAADTFIFIKRQVLTLPHATFTWWTADVVWFVWLVVWPIPYVISEIKETKNKRWKSFMHTQ